MSTTTKSHRSVSPGVSSRATSSSSSPPDIFSCGQALFSAIVLDDERAVRAAIHAYLSLGLVSASSSTATATGTTTTTSAMSSVSSLAGKATSLGELLLDIEDTRSVGPLTKDVRWTRDAYLLRRCNVAHVAALSGSCRAMEALLNYFRGSLSSFGANSVSSSRRSSSSSTPSSIFSGIAAMLTAQNGVGMNPFHIAAECGHVELLQLMVTFERNMLGSSTSSASVSSSSASSGSKPLLFGTQSIVDLRTSAGFTPLMLASAQGCLEAVSYLVEVGADPSLRTSELFGLDTALHLAARNGHVEVCRALVDAMQQDERRKHSQTQNKQQQQKNAIASINVDGKQASLRVEHGPSRSPWMTRRSHGVLPILDAVAGCGDAQVHDQLLSSMFHDVQRLGEKNKHWWSQNCVDDSFRHLVHYAATSTAQSTDGLRYCMTLMEEEKPTLWSRVDSFGCTPVHYAVACGCDSSLTLLVRRDATLVNKKNDASWTPLLLAAAIPTIEPDCIRTLLDVGASMLDVDERGCSALYYACKNRRADILSLVQSQKDLVSCASLHDSRGLSLAHFIASLNWLPAMEFLLENRIEIASSSNRWNITPLHVAFAASAADCVSFLLDAGCSKWTRESFSEYFRIRYGSEPDPGSLQSMVNRESRMNYQNEAACIFRQHFLLSRRDFRGRDPMTYAAVFETLDVFRSVLSNLIESTWPKFTSSLEGSSVNDCLYHACESGSPQAAEILIPLVLSVTEKSLLDPFLTAAIQSGSNDVVRLILKKSPSLTGKSLEKALHSSISFGHVEILRSLCSFAETVDPKDSSLRTPLHAACRLHRPDMIRILLNAGARVNEHGEHEYTALHECAVSNSVDCAEELLSFSPDVESRDRDKRTPLILASLYGHREMCILLLNHGASVGATDRFGRSFLHYAARCGLQSVFEWILSYLAIESQSKCFNLLLSQDDSGRNVFHYAAMADDGGFLCRYLLNAFVPRMDDLLFHPHFLDYAGWSFLHYAAILERVEIIALILSLVQELEHAPTIVLCPIFTCPYRLSGCIDPIDCGEAGNRVGDTMSTCSIFHLASLCGSIMLFDILTHAFAQKLADNRFLDHSAFEDSEHSTPLHWAAVADQSELSDHLLSLGFSPLTQNVKGVSPLEIASFSDRKEIMLLFVKWLRGNLDEPLDRGLCYRAGLCAAYSGSTESINLLYSHELLSDADMSTSICKEADGNVTLAAVAVFANRVPVLRNLADKSLGFSPDICGRNVCHVAALLKREECLSFLGERFPHLFLMEDSSGCSPVQYTLILGQGIPSTLKAEFVAKILFRSSDSPALTSIPSYFLLPLLVKQQYETLLRTFGELNEQRVHDVFASQESLLGRNICHYWVVLGGSLQLLFDAFPSSVRSIIRRAMMEADLASWTPFLLGVARYGIRFLHELHSIGEIAWWISDSSLVNAVLSHASLPIDSRDSASIEMVCSLLSTCIPLRALRYNYCLLARMLVHLGNDHSLVFSIAKVLIRDECASFRSKSSSIGKNTPSSAVSSSIPPDKSQWSSLHAAVACRDLLSLELLTSNGYRLDGNATGKWNILHEGVLTGDENVVGMLLGIIKASKQLQLVNESTSSLLSPLHIAIFCRSQNIFLRLVKYGASFTAGGMKGVSSLHLAAGCGLHEIFRVLSNDLLKDELSLSARDSFGLSLLHWAALYGQLDVTRILVSIREDLCSLQDTYGLVPLDYAIMQRHADVIQVLSSVGMSRRTRTSSEMSYRSENIMDESDAESSDFQIREFPDFQSLSLTKDKSPDRIAEEELEKLSISPSSFHEQEYFPSSFMFDPRSPQAITSLFTMCARGDVEEVSRIIHLGVSADVLDPVIGETPVHVACSLGNVSLLKTLLSLGANPNSKSSDHRSPLHVAAANGVEEIVSILLACKGVDIDSVDIHGLTPLHESIVGGHVHIALSLLQVGADPLTFDVFRGSNPLLSAAKSGLHEIFLSPIVSHDALERSISINGDSLLHVAVRSSRPSIVGILLDRGLDPFQKNNDSLNALHLACAIGAIESIITLCQRTKHLEDLLRSTDSYGRYPLQVCVYENQLVAFETLLEYTPPSVVSATDVSLLSENILHTAVRGCHFAFVDRLISYAHSMDSEHTIYESESDRIRAKRTGSCIRNLLLAKDANQMTPSEVAIDLGEPEMARLLKLALSADVDIS